MLDVFALSVALSVGQGGTPALVPVPELPRNVAVPSIAPMPSAPARLTGLPTQRSVISVDPMPAPYIAVRQDPMTEAKIEPKADAPAEEEKKEEEEAPPEKGFFMKALEGTALGQKMEDKRFSISGWTQMSYTKGNWNKPTTLPVVWNDRNNAFLLQQHWLKMGKDIDADSKEFSWGWNVDAMIGTDYRFMMIRGLFNEQLLGSQINANEPGGFKQNLYGFDLPTFYLRGYAPNLFEGTEFRVGRQTTPWGVESIEGPTSPLLSRSYAFNWSPPFFHMAISALPKFSKNWSGTFMLANGNDVFIDPSQELRFVGALTHTSDDEKTTVTAATSFGRGKFNAGDPFNPATNGLMSEAAGRNNFNAFDIVINRKVTDNFTYALEAIYAYQTGVPTTGNVGALTGAAVNTDPVSVTANWWSVVNYFIYKHSDCVSSIVRAELFDDADGQRTGFEGVYYAGTFGIQFKPKDWLLVRPEIRYDYNGYSTPFNGGTQHYQWTAATDLIVRW